MSCSATSSFSEIPAYTKFHIAIGFTAIAFAAIAFATKAPTVVGCVERRIPARVLEIARVVHPIAGGVYAMCAIFMPITCVLVEICLPRGHWATFKPSLCNRQSKLDMAAPRHPYDGK